MAHYADKTHSGHDFIKRFTKQIRKVLPPLKIIKVELLSKGNKIVTWQRYPSSYVLLPIFSLCNYLIPTF
jgi:hypothetical protein